MSLSPLPNYIDGELVASRAASALEVKDPRTGETVALCPVSVQEDVDAAYAAARRAFAAWRLTTPAQRQELLLRLADAVEELSTDDAVALLSGLDASRAADVLDAMQPDDAADLVSDLPQPKATELLELMQPEEAEDVRRLMRYDEYTAGGLMTTEPIILPPEANVATFLAQARKAEVQPALGAIAFVCRPPLESPTGQFLGMVHFQRALRERPQRLLGSILDKALDPVNADDSIGTVTRLLATYNLTALPVLDQAGRLLGAVSVDDVLDHLMPDDWREADDEITDEMIERSANA